MPAKLTGAPRWSARHGARCARVTLADGRREPVPMPGIARDDVEGAKRMAAIVARRVRELGHVPAGTGETVNEWFKRWVEAREAKGLRSTANDRGRYAKWIAPVIGTKPIGEVGRRDLEELVQRLDRAVVAGEIGWKTATNVWGVASKMFGDACKSKALDLRAREDNPARDVQGPDRGIDRSGPYLFPAEYSAMMACDRVPPRWKRVITLAIYLYVRRGELAALEWGDVSLERRYVHVHRSLDEKGNVKPTKTGDTRKVPIDPALVPLLERMREDAGGEGRVVASMPDPHELAVRLRKYVAWALEDAGMPAREELFADDLARRPLSWHDLRHTGITWRAVRGDEPLKVQRAAGHSDLRTTQRYINEAQTFEDAGTFGTPFPALDVPALTALPKWAGSGPRSTSSTRSPQKNRVDMASPRGFEGDASASPNAHARPGNATDSRSGEQPPLPTSQQPQPDADAELRRQAKEAIDAGDTALAMKLLARVGRPLALVRGGR